jgi:hypothetical protein
VSAPCRLLLLAVALAVALVAETGCTDRPSGEEIERLRAEARALDARMTAVNELPRRVGQTLDRFGRPFRRREAGATWELVISGRIAAPAPVRLSIDELDALATTRVRTRNPFDVDEFKVPIFRGVRLSALVDRAGGPAGGASPPSSITIVAHDAFRATIDIADAYRHPIILALERDRRPIPRPEGGPLFLVFPHLDEPALKTRYPDRFWCFYVTHLIVGTEPARVLVGDIEVDGAALDALPQVTLEREVGYKVDWPATKVKLHGPRLRDVMAAAGLSVPAGGHVVVRGKPPIYRDPGQPTALGAEEVSSYDILLATRYGDERAPIPARLGGPVTLAYPVEVDVAASLPALIPKAGRARVQAQRRWLTFVEEVSVEP